MAEITSTERNLLVALLAFQNNLIDRSALLAAFSNWTECKSRPILGILVEQNKLTKSQGELIEALAEEHLRRNGNDPWQSLAGLNSAEEGRKLLASLQNEELQNSLTQFRKQDDPTSRVGEDDSDSEDPDRTVWKTVGSSTSSGQRFLVLRPHAEGGLGKVSIALDEELNREVALKEIKAKFADDPTLRARFTLEAEVTGGLEHPGIVPVYGLGAYADGRPYYAMRFIRGVSLKDGIQKYYERYCENPTHTKDTDRKLPSIAYETLEFRQLLRRIIEVCNAIAYAHARGVLHRDLKPGNIMLGKYGETLVVDWGLAKVIENSVDSVDTSQAPFASDSSSSTETGMGSVCGTLAYMSPEQAQGRVDLLAPATDIYCLGATLYHLLTGRPPHIDNSDGKIPIRIQSGDFPAPRSLNAAIPAALEAITLRAMATKPSKRYATPLDLAADIEHWLADEPVAAHRDSLLRKGQRWARRHRTLMTSATALLLTATLALFVSYLMLQSEQSRTLSAKVRAEAAEKRERIERSNALLRAKEAQAAAALAEERRQSAVTAEEQAKAETQAKRHLLYVTTMNLISSAWETGNVKRVKQLLNSQRPEATSNKDYRGFEWYYWWRQCHKYEATLPVNKGSALCVAANLSGTKIVAGTANGSIACWENGEALRSIPVCDFPLKTIVLTDRIVASPGPQNTIAIIDFKTGEIIKSLPGHEDSVSALAVNQAGTRLLSGSADGDLKLWDIPQGKVLWEQSHGESPVRKVAYAWKKPVLAVLYDSGDLTILNEQTGETIAALPRNEQFVDMDFNPSTTQLAVCLRYGGQDRIEIFDSFTGDKIKSWRGHGDATVDTIAFLLDKTLITGSSDETLKVWNDSGDEVLAYKGHESAISALAKKCSKPISASSDGTVRIWKPVSQYTREIILEHKGVRALAFSPNGRSIAAAADGRLIIADVEPGSKSRQFLDGHSQRVWDIDFHPSENMLASGYEDGSICIWDLQKEGPPRVLDAHRGLVVSVKFSADGKTLLSASRDGRVIIWDVETFQPRREFRGHDSVVIHATLSADGEWAASIGGKSATDEKNHSGSLMVWNTRTLELRYPSRGIQLTASGSRYVAFSPDGKRLAYASSDAGERLMVFDAKTGALERKLLNSGTNGSCPVAFSPDSRCLAFGSLSTITIWDVETGLEVIPGQRFSDAFLWSLKFSPDGSRLAAGNYGGAVGLLETTLHPSMHPRSRENALRELQSPASP